MIVGETNASADDLLATRSEDERTERTAAADWLADELADGQWHVAQPLIREATNAGHARATLYRARTELGVESQRFGAPEFGQPARSKWRLPVVSGDIETTGEAGGEATGKTPVNAGDSGGSAFLLSHSQRVETTGANGDRAERAEELLERHRDLFDGSKS